MEKESSRTKAARMLGSLSADAATPEQRVSRASKGGKAAQKKLTKTERSRRAKLGWEKRRAAKAKREKGETCNT